MKFKDMTDTFWGTCGRVTEEEVKDNKDRLTTAWQPHHWFEAPVVQIETYLVYSHVTKKCIPDSEFIDTFLICNKQTGCYQTGFNPCEMFPDAKKICLADTNY